MACGCGGCNLKPILHFALGLRFGKVCEQKCEKTSTGSRFCTQHIVYFRNIFLPFSRVG